MTGGAPDGEPADGRRLEHDPLAGIDLAAAAATPGAWLELAVSADHEAVEAVSEILSRAAPGGTSVEPAFELVEEGLAARVDLERPAQVRAHLPLLDVDAVRAAVARADRELGHLQAFGLRPIGDLTTRVVHEEDWANAWKAHFPVLRVGRRIVIRPTWRRHKRQPDDVVLALDPGHGVRDRAPPDDAAVPRRARVARGPRGPAVGGADGGPARVLDVGSGSGILSIAAGLLGAGPSSPWTWTRSRSRPRPPTRRATGSGGVITSREGSAPSGEGPFDVVLGQPHRRRCSSGSRTASSRTCGPAARSWPPGSSRTARPRSSRRSPRGACGSRKRWAEGEWVALEVVRPDEQTRPLRYDRADGAAPHAPGSESADEMPDLSPLFPLILATHITLAIALFVPSLLLPFTLRNRLVNAGYEAPEPSGFVRLAALDPGPRDDRDRRRPGAHRDRDDRRPRAADARAAVAPRQPRDVRDHRGRRLRASSALRCDGSSGATASRPRPTARRGEPGPAASATSPTAITTAVGFIGVPDVDEAGSSGDRHESPRGRRRRRSSTSAARSTSPRWRPRRGCCARPASRSWTRAGARTSSSSTPAR